MNTGQRIGVGLGIAISVLLILVSAVPQSYIPKYLARVTTAEGRFEGKPIRLSAPESRDHELPISVWIKMDHGSCRGSVKTETTVTGLFSIGQGHCRANIPVGSELVLDPQGNNGDYGVTIGLEWLPLGPKGRHFVLLPMGISVMVASIFARKFGRQVRKTGARRLLFLLALAVISGLMIYPVLHEGGHLLLGMLLGAEPDWDGVVWTCLSGQEPHASFRDLPQKAGPFMSAGGVLVPTVVALLLLLIWRLISQKALWYLRAGLLWVAVLILFSTLGCLFELYQNTHMDALSAHFGFSGPLRIGFSLSPLLVALAAYLWVALRLRECKRENPPVSLKPPSE